MPLAPARERAGGLISAGMISTVQTPLPILAQTVPKVCPAFWAPSPESETISTIRWATVVRTRSPVGAVAVVVGLMIAPVISTATELAVERLGEQALFVLLVTA